MKQIAKSLTALKSQQFPKPGVKVTRMWSFCHLFNIPSWTLKSLAAYLFFFPLCGVTTRDLHCCRFCTNLGPGNDFYSLFSAFQVIQVKKNILCSPHNAVGISLIVGQFICACFNWLGVNGKVECLTSALRPEASHVFFLPTFLLNISTSIKVKYY